MHQSMQLRVCLQNSSDSKYTLHTWPPDKSKTANLPAEIPIIISEIQKKASS